MIGRGVLTTARFVRSFLKSVGAQSTVQPSQNVLGNDATRWRSCSGVPRGRVNRIGLWPLRRDDHSGVLIGAGGTWRSDWPARVLATDVSARIDR